LLATGRVIGQAVSVAVAGAVFASLGGAAAGATLATRRGSLPPGAIGPLQGDFVRGFQAALLVCAAFAAIGALTALVRGQEQRPPAAPAR
jgi:hypothetical protein